MTCKFLQLNSDKTEMTVHGPTYLRYKLRNYIVTLDDIYLTSKRDVRNQGIVFDKDLSFDSHIKQSSRCAFSHFFILVNNVERFHGET